MKKEFKGALLGIALILALGAGRRYVYVTQTSLNEGNNPVPYSTELFDSSWLAIGSSSPSTRRALGIQAPASNTGFVCVSTISLAAVTCTVETNGYQLEPGAAIIINDEAVWYGRAESGTVTTAKGTDHSDNAD